ncbi:myotubularin protein 13 [Echinococcus multilocularis]|uniref:Myotubularin protein 13 n=1 Tax=Echinococcus multilocularis TaxID=6211 RepID=A0A068Y877_ECHMU|nr:myotubularin protein 13 [Echinococcus multilocularis]
MIRLADYVVIVGYDFDKSIEFESQGRVLQRFPTKEWSNYPYEFHVESFCQPCGWRLTTNRQAPTFFVAYLTGIDGSRYYAACLTFYEAVSGQQQHIIQHLSHGNRSTNATDAHHHQTVAATSPTGSLSHLNSCESLAVVSGNFNGASVDPNLIRPTELFAPKCIVLLARHQHFKVLQNCLSILYTTFMDSPKEFNLEEIIGNIVGGIEIPPIGGPRKTFTVGANDRQTVQPAKCRTIPVTRSSVANLFKYLGIDNVLLMFTAILSDQKLLVCSQSLVRLTEACHALTSIIYPLKYGNTYVPILPRGLLDYLSAPTPFLYGIHASYRHLLPDIPDVFIADLDVGRVIRPENIPLPQIPQPFLTEAIQSLFHILSPDLLISDNVYPPPPETLPQLTPEQIDKKLRAVFLHLFASIFVGYRSCLTITRIHPQPVIHFNRSLFLVLRGVHEPDDFFDRLLSSMRFHQFVLERGPPFRVCDLFDEAYDVARTKAQPLVPQFVADVSFPDMDYEAFLTDFTFSLNRIAQKFMENEHDEGHQIVDIIQAEAVEAHNRLHHRPFPRLNAQKVDDFVQVAQELRSQSAPLTMEVEEKPRIVPKGEQLDRNAFKSELPSDKCRVIREFVADIFDLHITEALKRRNTIRQDLKSQPFRRLFVDELCKRIIPPMASSESLNSTFPEAMTVEFERRASLNWEQFDVIVGLLDEALRYEGMSYNTVIAPPVLELTTRISTQLGGMRYFANMTHHIQRHRIWSEMSFWEDVFNEQVNNQIKQLYLHQSEEERKSGIPSADLPTIYSSDQSVLEIAAEELRSGGLRSAELQASLQQQEEGTVYAQILHFINLIVNFRVPLNAAAPLIPSTDQFGGVTSAPASSQVASVSGVLPAGGAQQYQRGLPNGWPAGTPSPINHLHDRRDLSFTSTLPSSNHNERRSVSHGGSSSGVGGGGLGQHHGHHVSSIPPGAGGTSSSSLSRDAVPTSDIVLGELAEWICKFVEKVGTENALPEASIIQIKNKVDSILEGHLLNLADIYPEVKKIPKIKKPEIANPALLTDESIIRLAGLDRLPCQLLIDGRMERVGDGGGSGGAGGGDWSRSEQMVFFDANNTNVMAPPSHEIFNEEVDSVIRTLLPAQGALFVTNYRVIFIGVPKDPFQSNKVVCRSFPVAALHSIKRMGSTRVVTTIPVAPTIAASLEMGAGGGSSGKKQHRKLRVGGVSSSSSSSSSTETLDIYRLRALTMQMMRLGFDPDEVPSEARDDLRHLLVELRFHAIIGLSFNSLNFRASQALSASENANGYRSPLPRPASYRPMSQQSQEMDGGLGLVQSKQSDGDDSVSLSIVSSSRSGRSSLSQSQTASTMQAALTQATGPRLRDPSVVRSVIDTATSYRLSDTDSLEATTTGLSDDSLRVGEFTDEKSLLSMTLASLRLAGLNPAISEVLQHSPGYLDVAKVALHSTDYCKHPSSTSPLSSIHSSCASASNSQHKPQQPLYSPVITLANANYAITRTYPSLLIVPAGFKRSRLDRVARYHKHGRFPVVVWQHMETRAFLLRGAAFQAKSVLSAFKHTVVTNAVPERQSVTTTTTTTVAATDVETSTEISSAKEHARYFASLVNMSPMPSSALGLMSASTTASIAGSVPGREPLSPRINSMMLLATEPQGVATPSPSPRGVGGTLAHEKTGSLLRVPRASSRVRRALGKFAGGKASTTSYAFSHDDEKGSATSSSTQHLYPESRMPTTLYVLCERSVKTMMKSGQFPGVEFISVDYASYSSIRATFRKLYNACLPKDAHSRLVGVFKERRRGGSIDEGGGGGGGFTSDHENNLAAAVPSEKAVGSDGGSRGVPGDIITAVAESGWLEQIQSLLQLAGIIVEIISFQGASVAVCLEDGTDIVTQTVSLAQVMMDPTYRTISGFWALVEKEWLLFGHPFNQRVGQKSGSNNGKASHISPVFLQFLDAVHQLLRQFPLSFEFNDFFLQFLAYHHVSNRFHDFKHDFELQRMAHWLNLAPDHSSLTSGIYQTHSIWRFVQDQHEEWPVFFNFYYSPECAQKTLIPATHQAALNVWKYYLSEDLASGPVFDLDLFCPSYRKQTNRPYEPVLRQGYNNSHVEQTYALLGLREGDEAVGWQEAWSKAVRLSADTENTIDEPFSSFPELPLSEEAGADFDRIVRAKLAATTTDDRPIVLNTTLKPPPPLPECSFNSLPKHTISTTTVGFEILGGGRSCISDGVASLPSESDGEVPLASEEDGHRGYSPPVDECDEAQRVVFAQNRAITMKCLNHTSGRPLNNSQLYHNQASTLAVPTPTADNVVLLPHSLHHSGSLNNLPVVEGGFGNLIATALFEQPHSFRRVKTTLSVSRCDACQALILASGITRGLVRCVDCNFCCHEKCVPGVSRNCPGRLQAATHRYPVGSTVETSGLPGTNVMRPWNRQRAKTEDRNLHQSTTEPESLNLSNPHFRSRYTTNATGSSEVFSLYEANGKNADCPPGNLPALDSNPSQEIRGCAPAPPDLGSVAFCGELYKLSSRKVLASWKSRFFVLDTEHHQMRYYDTAQDEVPRGFIDLQDVRAVTLLRNTTSVPKRFQDSCAFEIDTPARQFRFAADDAKSARAWVERIQSTIL